ncbi:unnamed protein product [Moneuplotes crassus]|uniref:Uncharacterized protein n=1 Tax=Euplotes crassus TaxID=5936 RepID=A0AAD1XJB2_EUPCR|nr:unnamed protein product [Moneuplotes crassus]
MSASKPEGPDRQNRAEGHPNPVQTNTAYTEDQRYFREGQDSLKPVVQQINKHWYDEYPVGDRRKQLEDSLKSRKGVSQSTEPRENQSLYQKKEYPSSNKDQKYSQPPIYSDYEPIFISKDGLKSHEEFNPALYKKTNTNSSQENLQRSVERDYHRSTTYAQPQRIESIERKDFYSFGDSKQQSKSYNRSNGTHKRVFVEYPERQEHQEHKDQQKDINNYRRSASHGFERNFRAAPPSYTHPDPQEAEYLSVELNFNKKSVNYNMNEIELPAYCKAHPDGKLLYILTAGHQESELGCAHCAMNSNKSEAGYEIREVKEKLAEYITSADKLLKSGSTTNLNECQSSSEEITTIKDREIARVRNYYDQVMEALTQERDKHIAEIEHLSQQNLHALNGKNNSKKPKVDFKLNNFCIELSKVVEGVDDTGIHIKELLKINQDYKDVVSQKLKSQRKRAKVGNPELIKFEFQPAKQEVLKSFAERIGTVLVYNSSTSCFGGAPDTNYKPGGIPYSRKEERTSHFGIDNHEGSNKYAYNGEQRYTESENGPFKSVSPTRDQNYKLQNEKYSNYPSGSQHSSSMNGHYSQKYAGQFDKNKEAENMPKGDYTPIMPYNRENKEYQRDAEQPNHYKGGSHYDDYKKGIYDKAASQKPVSGYPPSADPRLDPYPDRDVDDIKKEYAFNEPIRQGTGHLYESYKKQAKAEISVKEGNKAYLKEDQKSTPKKQENPEGSSKKSKKIKQKTKAEKEKVLKTIKLKTKQG